jgi:hypothetical protein
MDDTTSLNALLARSAELQDTLAGFLGLSSGETGPRSRVSRAMCGISFEHAEGIKILTAAGNFTSAVGLMRLQYEAVVRAFWVLYTASDSFVDKLAASLSKETERKASKLPMVGEMLEKLESKAPEVAMDMLKEFREHQWRPLSSFVHGGLHAIHRHDTGYPVVLLLQVVRSSNGLLMMAAMLLVILHGGGNQRGKMAEIQKEFADCLPPANAVEG